jgi:DNA processing protein
MNREQVVRLGVAVSRLAPVAARRLRRRWGGWEAAAAAADHPEVPERWKDALRGAEAAGRRAAAAAAAAGARLLWRGGPDWPPALEGLSDPPEVLFVRGRAAALAEPSVAVVGTRECTVAGADLAAELACRLAESGLGVVSGMARGIDTAAHRGALRGGGDTIAVLGCGPDVPYPPENADLLRTLAAEGAVVSEFAPGVEPRPSFFPRRNRILAALADAVIVVEARLRSGALVTARHALDQGKEILVVPGWPAHPLAAGPLALLRDGARAVRHADDVLEDLGGIAGGPRPSPGEREAREAVEAGAGTPAELAASLGIPEAEARERLARLELLGHGAAGG